MPASADRSSTAEADRVLSDENGRASPLEERGAMHAGFVSSVSPPIG